LELTDVVRTFTSQWQFKYAIVGLTVIGIVLATLRKRYPLDTNTGLNPDNMSEVQERNDRVNPWLQVDSVPLPMSAPAKTTTAENLASSLGLNMVGVISDARKTTLGFFVCSNFLVIPTHFIHEHGNRDISVTCYRKGENVVGGSFRDKISIAFRYNIPETDFTLCYVTSGGSMRDFRKFLTESSIIGKTEALFVTRAIATSVVEVLPTLFKGSSRVAHTKSVFNVSYYTLPKETHAGMCMSPIISKGKGSCILGFHLGGKSTLGVVEFSLYSK
jgi:hypothetical protein